MKARELGPSTRKCKVIHKLRGKHMDVVYGINMGATSAEKTICLLHYSNFYIPSDCLNTLNVFLTAAWAANL